MNVTGHWFLLLIRCQRPGFISSVFSVLFLFPCNDCSSETFHCVNPLLQSDVHLMLLLFYSCSFVCSFVWLAFRCRYCSELPCACGWMFILVCIIKWCYTHFMKYLHSQASRSLSSIWYGMVWSSKMSTAYMITGEFLSFAKQDAGSFITGSKLKYHIMLL